VPSQSTFDIPIPASSAPDGVHAGSSVPREPGDVPATAPARKVAAAPTFPAASGAAPRGLAPPLLATPADARSRLIVGANAVDPLRAFEAVIAASATRPAPTAVASRHRRTSPAPGAPGAPAGAGPSSAFGGASGGSPGGLALLVLSFVTLVLGASYRLSLGPAVYRPLAFISLLERPG
jgi:hypothetical protein